MHPSGTANKDESTTVLQSIIDDQVRKTAVVMNHEVNQSTDKETDPRARPEHELPADNDALGAAILPLITDWSWVKRRVETMQLITNGQTRRRLSFDFELPYSQTLHYQDSTEQAVVPFAFLRKGMLINLDISLAGEPISSLEFGPNGELTYQAMRLVAKELHLAEYLKRVLGHLGLGELERCINQGIADIIYSSRTDRTAYFTDTVRRVQDTHRHHLFATLALSASLIRNQSSVEPVQLSLWRLNAGQIAVGGKVVEGEQSESTDVLDSSLGVHCLALALMLAIESNRQNSDVLQQIELLGCLLSTTSLSYLFTVVAPAERLWERSDGKKNAFTPKRCTAKLVCDAEESSFNPEEDSVDGGDTNDRKPAIFHDVYKVWKEEDCVEVAADRRPKRTWWPYSLKRIHWVTKVNLAYSTLSAGSTHIEIEPPENSTVVRLIGLVNAPLVKDGETAVRVEEATGQVEVNSPCVKGVNLGGGTHHNDPGSIDEFYSRMGKESPHGTSRTSQSRVHLSNTSPQRALAYLQVWLAPQPGLSPLLANILVWISLLLSFFFTWDVAASKPDNGGEPVGLFDAVGIALDSYAILLALFGVLWFTTGTHQVSKHMWSIPKVHVAWSAVMSLVLLISPSVQAVMHEKAICLQALVLVPVAYYLAASTQWVYRYTKFCSQEYKNVDTILRSVLKEETLMRESVSVMETGAWDCEYLTDRYAWFHGHRFDTKEYLKDLQKQAAEIASKNQPQKELENDDQEFYRQSNRRARSRRRMRRLHRRIAEIPRGRAGH